MLAFIVVLLIVGLIAGAIARLVVPGRDPMGLLGTMSLGIVGSFVGGFLENVVFLHTLSLWSLHPSGIPHGPAPDGLSTPPPGCGSSGPGAR